MIRTQDSNFDVEFSGDLKVSEYGYTLSSVAGTGVSEVHTYDLATVPSPDGKLDYQLAITPTAPAVVPAATTITISNAVDMDDLITKIVAADPATFEVSTTPPTAGMITVSKDNNGNLVLKHNDTDKAFSSILKVDVNSDGNFDDGILKKRNGDYSGREGTGAEFLEIRTKIDQTASKGGLQLRLDTLGISDSAFGDFSVDTTGLITMSQDGAMFAVGQIAIAKFITNRGLEPIGNNLLKSTLASGDPIYNLNNNKTAEVKANTLELSTADLSESLVNLMVFQRAFEANSKSITTADTILNTLIQLKR